MLFDKFNELSNNFEKFTKKIDLNSKIVLLWNVFAIVVIHNIIIIFFQIRIINLLQTTNRKKI